MSSKKSVAKKNAAPRPNRQDRAQNAPDNAVAAVVVPETPLEFAAKHIASACAAASNLVRVLSFNPLTTAPAELFELSFKAIGIISPEQIAFFRAHLIQFLPAKFAPLLQDNQLPLGADTNIRGVVHYVEATVFKLGF